MSRHLHQIERDAEAVLIAVLSWPVAVWFLVHSAWDLGHVVVRRWRAAR